MATLQLFPSGTVGNSLTDNTWYDGTGNEYSEAQSVAGDTILRQMETHYDDASNVIQVTIRWRNHNATGTGELNGPDGVQPKARVSYVANWHDALGRTIATTNYGTNGGSTLSRPSMNPARSDNVLVSSNSFDSAGNCESETNPGGIVNCFHYDAVPREIERILNCTNFGSSSSSSPISSSSSSSGFPDSADTDIRILSAYNADSNSSTTDFGRLRW